LASKLKTRAFAACAHHASCGIVVSDVDACQRGEAAWQLVAFDGLAAAPELAHSQYQARLGGAGR
jgi:hypothetical protein